MQGKMKAYVFEAANRAAVRDVPIPEISDDEVLIKIKACGICHTDLMVLTGVNIVPVPFPFIGGHEWSGEVVRAGANVITFKPGDRVVGEGNSGCGSCKACQEGKQDYCSVAPVQRGINCDGAMAEYYRTLPRLLHKIPESMDWKTASMIEPFSIAYNGIHSIGGCDAADTVVVQGGGSIGLCAVAAAKAMGARVMCVEPLEYRRKAAIAMKADYVIDPVNEDAVKTVNGLTDGYGADLVVEASGSSGSYRQSLDFVRNNGRISYLGVNVGVEIPVEIGKIQMWGLRAQGYLGSPGIWGRVITFIERGGIDLSPISTQQYPLARAHEAFEFARNINDNELIKVTLLMDQEVRHVNHKA